MSETAVDEALALLSEHQHTRHATPDHEPTAATRAGLAAAQRTVDAYMAISYPDDEALADETDMTVWHRALPRPRLTQAAVVLIQWALVALVAVLATHPEQQLPSGLLLGAAGLAAAGAAYYTVQHLIAWRRWRIARRLRF